MTVAVIAGAVTAEVRGCLEREYGWQLVMLPDIRSPIPLDGSAFDPAAVEALVVEAQPVTAQTFAAMPSLRVLACLRGDPVNVDLEAATRHGVPVLCTPGRNRESVADFVLGLMISVTRHIAVSHHLIMNRELTEADAVAARRPPRRDVIWRPADTTKPLPYDVYRGPEIASLVLGVIGFGEIGRRVAEKARALEMEVRVHDPWVAEIEIEAIGARSFELGELLSHSDVVSLHARALGPPILGAAEIALMKRGSYLINTSRASQVDYAAMAAALRSGHLAGAGLDVFPDEPLPSSSPLLELPNVTLTPHLAGASTNVVEHQSALLVEGLAALAEGSDALRRRAVKNPEVLEAR
jgi:D-3-phosphoglycerate dehydrogenase / 2-oxoglutarate reductase